MKPKFFYLSVLVLILSVFITSCKKSGGDTNVYNRSGDGLTNSTPVGINVTPSSVDLYPYADGIKTKQLSVSVQPSAANQGVKYAIISGSDVISIDNKGLVTAKKPGSATVSVCSIERSTICKNVTVSISGSNIKPGQMFQNVAWELPQSLPIRGEQITFSKGIVIYKDNLPTPKTHVDPDDVVSLIGHYRIAYITVKDDKGDVVIDNIVGTGNNMRGEFAVNAEQCDITADSPMGLRIRMQYKHQFHRSLADIPENFKYIRHDILKPLESAKIDAEFKKIGAVIKEDSENTDQYVVAFTLTEKDLPMPKGYKAEIILKKISDDVALQSKIILNGEPYFSDDDAVKDVTILNHDLVIVKGNKAQIDYEITPVNAANKEVTFESTNTDILTVDENTGEVTAVSAGYANIIVTTKDGGFKAETEVRVINEFVPLKSFSIFGMHNASVGISTVRNDNTRSYRIDFNPSNATNKKLKVVSYSQPNILSAEIREDDETGESYLFITGIDVEGTQNVAIEIGVEDEINNPNVATQTVNIEVRDDRQKATDLKFYTATGVEVKSYSLDGGPTYNDNLEYVEPATYYIYQENNTYTKDDSLGLSNGKFKLNAVAQPEDIDVKTVIFETSNEDVATVDENGVVTLHNSGKVTITMYPLYRDPNPAYQRGLTKYYTFNVEKMYKEVQSLTCEDVPSLTVYNQDKQKLRIGFNPSDASNQGLNYSVPTDSIVSVDANGNVNYNGNIYANESDASNFADTSVPVTITSISNPRATITCNVSVSKTYVAPKEVSITNFDEINNKSLKANDYSKGRVQIKAIVSPDEASNKNLKYEVTSGSDVVSVDANGYVTALKAGSATVKVSSQADDKIYKEVKFTVWEKLSLTGSYNIAEMAITYNGTTINSKNQTTLRNNQLSFSISTNENSIRISGKMQLAWKHFVDNPTWDLFRFKYFNYEDKSSMPEESMNAATYKSKGIDINGDTITFTLPFEVKGDELVYKAGSSNKIMFKVNNRRGSFSAANANRFTEVTPINFNDPYTFKGTYDISHFTQDNSMGTAVCGTLGSYGGVERMIGELTIDITGTNSARNVAMISKIQMNSSTLQGAGTIVGQCVSCGQFAYTNFTGSTLSPNASSFGSTGSRQSGVATIDGNYLRIRQEFSQSIATVSVNTWMRKKSDKVANLSKDECYFGYMNAGSKANALSNGYCKAPSQEPDYSLGVVK